MFCVAKWEGIGVTGPEGYLLIEHLCLLELLKTFFGVPGLRTMDWWNTTQKKGGVIHNKSTIRFSSSVHHWLHPYNNILQPYLAAKAVSSLNSQKTWELTYPIQEAVGKMSFLSHWWDMYGLAMIVPLEGKRVNLDTAPFHPWRGSYGLWWCHRPSCLSAEHLSAREGRMSMYQHLPYFEPNTNCL